MTDPSPIRWKVLLRRFGDGDTTRVFLIQWPPTPVGHRLGTTTVTSDWDNGAPIRLTHVDAPERGHPDYHTVRGWLIDWLTAHEPWLEAVTYQFDNFGRYVGDLYDHRTGDTASAHLLSLGVPLWED